MKSKIDLDSFKLIFENMINASCIDEIVYDEAGNAVDYRILHVNKAFEEMFCVTLEEIAGRLASDVYGINPPLFLDIYERIAATGKPESFESFFPPRNLFLKVNVCSLKKGFFSTIIQDVTKEKHETDKARRSHDRLKRVVRLLQKDVVSTRELFDEMLEEVIELTGSKFGYIHVYSEETREFNLISWSKNVMSECKVINPQTCYELDRTGLWGEAVRQARPIMVNDYSAENPYKKRFAKWSCQD
ncbi:MAG: hypothetical protein Kow0029_02120 [Candidatus Rifleibacteriota bacterium]